MVFTVLKALDNFGETLKAEERYKNELKTYGPVKAEELKRNRFASRRAENKRKARRGAMLCTAFLSPIPLLLFLLSSAGGAPIMGFVEAILLALFFWLLTYLLERIRCYNPYE